MQCGGVNRGPSASLRHIGFRSQTEAIWALCPSLIVNTRYLITSPGQGKKKHSLNIKRYYGVWNQVKVKVDKEKECLLWSSWEYLKGNCLLQVEIGMISDILRKEKNQV